MPEISLFYGIRITMYWSDHNPPHFHAEYGNNHAILLIEDGIVSEGYLTLAASTLRYGRR